MAAERATKVSGSALARAWASRILLGINVALFAALVAVFAFRGERTTPPWDGPAVVTVVLAVATIVLAAVGLGVALLAVWGYTTLREHAGNIAKVEAADAAARAADERVQKLLEEWGISGGPESGDDEVAGAYERE